MKEVNKNNTHSSTIEDLYAEERGKVGMGPISVDDIRRLAQDEEASDEDLSSSFKFIQARISAAKEFLIKIDVSRRGDPN